MEAVHQTDGQNMTTINLSVMEASSSDSTIISTRTQQFKYHPHLLSTTYSGSYSTFEEGTFIQQSFSL